jgi:hypothetical protein
MYRIEDSIRGNRCWIKILESTLTAGLADELCDVTEFSRHLSSILNRGVTEIDVDLSELRQIDEAGYWLLRRLGERVALTLILPEDVHTIEPLALGVLLYTRFEWKQLEFAA